MTGHLVCSESEVGLCTRVPRGLLGYSRLDAVEYQVLEGRDSAHLLEGF